MLFFQITDNKLFATFFAMLTEEIFTILFLTNQTKYLGKLPILAITVAHPKQK